MSDKNESYLSLEDVRDEYLPNKKLNWKCECVVCHEIINLKLHNKCPNCGCDLISLKKSMLIHEVNKLSCESFEIIDDFIQKADKRNEEELLEKLAELEHEQWTEWSRSLIKELLGNSDKTKHEIAISVYEKHKSWLQYWKQYSELSEEVKEMDREWARKVLKIIRDVE